MDCKIKVICAASSDLADGITYLRSVWQQNNKNELIYFISFCLIIFYFFFCIFDLLVNLYFFYFGFSLLKRQNVNECLGSKTEEVVFISQGTA